jgi:hypothetical protein
VEEERPKATRWFQQAVTAIKQLGASDDWNAYSCPLCRRDFPIEALATRDLTFEHAPPESLGGSEICLTCRSCNNDSGRGVDAQMRKAENLLELALGKMTEPRPVLLQIGPARIAANYYHGGGGILMFGVPKASSPLARQQMQAEMDRLHETQETPFRFSVQPHRDTHDARLASVGWLRAAFLVAFAAFGYGFAYSSRLQLVRSQLDAPSTSIIRTFATTHPTVDPAIRRLLIVEEPHQLSGSLAVQMGRHLVFLPFTADGLYEQLAGMAKKSARFNFNLRGLPVAWPKEPRHLIDLGRLPWIRLE